MPILDISKIEAGGLTLEDVDFRLSQVLDNVTALTEPHVRQKGLALTVESSPELTDVLHGDPGRIRQILLNLIGNATKFTEQGSITLQVSQKSCDGDLLEIAFHVSDTGIGLTEEEQAKVFDRFAQADGSITRKYGGTGLGLAICKDLAALMGGAIGVRSVPGQGATFWFTVCCARGNVDKLSGDYLDDSFGNIPGATQDGDTGSPQPRSWRILVAEDNPINQLVVTDTLEGAGHSVDVVSNGIEAVAAARAGQYDLILMDIFMPEMDGLTAAKQIQNLPGEQAAIPIIALTADAMAGEREKYLAAGMSDYVSKPFETNQLLDTIARHAANTGKRSA